MNPTPDLRTVAEVAALLRVHEKTVRSWIADGRLPVVRAGRAVRVRSTDLEAFIEGTAA